MLTIMIINSVEKMKQFQQKNHYFLDRGCPAATLRVWPWKERDKTPLELCGDNLEHNSQILSETNIMRVS